MTSAGDGWDSYESELPIGFGLKMISGEGAIVCDNCGRRWRAKVPLNEENRNYLADHFMDHLPVTGPRNRNESKR